MAVLSCHYPAVQWHYISVNSSKWPSPAQPAPSATGLFGKGIIWEFGTGGWTWSARTVGRQIVAFSARPILKLRACDLNFTLISERLQFILIDFYNQLSHTSLLFYNIPSVLLCRDKHQIFPKTLRNHLSAQIIANENQYFPFIGFRERGGLTKLTMNVKCWYPKINIAII